MEQQAELSVNTSQKNKKQIFIYVLSSISMLASVACVSFVLAVVLLPELSTRIRTFFLVMLGAAVFSLLSVVLFFIAGKNVKSRRKIMHAVLIFYFAVYVIVFIGFVFLVRAYTNRLGFGVSYNPKWLAEALPNLMPFKFFISNAKTIANGSGRMFITLFDIFGNFVVYMPIAFFLPIFSQTYRKFDAFFPPLVFIAICVEMFQGMFSLGTCCTDDIILGVLGAVLVFWIMRWKKVDDFLIRNGIYFGN